jgi:N-acyl-D-amino-acid deacylase
MSDRAPDPDELEKMADLVREALEDGALGFSTGLVYPPQVNADTEEGRTVRDGPRASGPPRCRR